jgi:hypothetical protein
MLQHEHSMQQQLKIKVFEGNKIKGTMLQPLKASMEK